MKRDLIYRLTVDEFENSQLEQLGSSTTHFTVRAEHPVYHKIEVGIWRGFSDQDCVRVTRAGLDEDIKKILSDYYEPAQDWTFESDGYTYLFSDIGSISRLPLVKTPDNIVISSLAKELWRVHRNKNDGKYQSDDLTLRVIYHNIPLDLIQKSGLPKRLYICDSREEHETRYQNDKSIKEEKAKVDAFKEHLKREGYDLSPEFI